MHEMLDWIIFGAGVFSLLNHHRCKDEIWSGLLCIFWWYASCISQSDVFARANPFQLRWALICQVIRYSDLMRTAIHLDLVHVHT
jgi:hypothetical protein